MQEAPIIMVMMQAPEIMIGDFSGNTINKGENAGQTQNTGDGAGATNGDVIRNSGDYSQNTLTNTTVNID